MLKQLAGCSFFPLSTGSSDSPAFTPGGSIKFQLSTLPRNLGSLAYYLYGVFLTFTGTLTQSGGTGALINDQTLTRLLVDYLALQNAWHGTPISAQMWKGYWLPTILAVGGGYNLSAPVAGPILAANGATTFTKTMFIPLALGNGDKPHHTAQLNVLYRNAYLELGCQASSPLSIYSPGATFSGLTVRASAACLPEPEIRVGPGVEWVDYQQSASTGQTQVILDSFGNNTQLINTEPGAGVAFAMAMSNNFGQPGSFDPIYLTQVSIPFRSQIQTSHVFPFVGQQLASQGPRRSLGTLETSDFPYGQNGAIGALEVSGLLGLPIVPQPTGFQTSKMQVVSGDTSYYLSMGSGPNGTHHTLVQHVRSWAPQAWAEALKVITDSKLVNDVFGSNASGLAWAIKMGNGKNPSDVQPHKLRFLPMALKPVAHTMRRQQARR
jgi:hypothetical protein